MALEAPLAFLSFVSSSLERVQQWPEVPFYIFSNNFLADFPRNLFPGGKVEMATFASDFAFGIASEKANHKILETLFKTPFTRRGGKAVIDFDSKDANPEKPIYAELKTRRIRSDIYDTALIGANKVDYAASTNSSCWFIYNYVDGIFGIQYDKQKFSTYAKGYFQRGNRIDCCNSPQLCYYIPRTDLIKLSL